MTDNLRQIFRAFGADARGNISILFGVSVTVILLGIAIAVDYSRMTSASQRLSDLTDGAALAGAYVAETHVASRHQIARNSLEENGYFNDHRFGSTEPDIAFDDQAREVTVSVRAPVGMLFAGFLGKERPVTSVSVAGYLTEDITPVSISFALDVSGSMGNNTADGEVKIQVLKDATKSLFTAIETSVRNPDLLRNKVRTGMTAYNTEVVATEPMGWGWDTLENSVDNLVAEGGTNSTPALQGSLYQLVNDSFQPADLRQFIIFMTDGDNNQIVWDGESRAVCMDARSRGIEIYSVAFAAPDKGQALLVSCATPNNEPSHDNGNNAFPNEACDNANGGGVGLQRCKEDKSEHYFDAEDAESFEAAFKRIGEEIAKIDLRIKS